MNLKPLGDRLIVAAVEEDEVTASGIVLPETAKEKPQRGKVLAVGDGRLVEGKRVPLEVSGPTKQVTVRRERPAITSIAATAAQASA
jgi:co-chaperonin GroES (HSP10)